VFDFSSCFTTDLSLNDFSGPIPASLNNLNDLVYLFLAANEFTPGPFPDLSNLEYLEELSLKSTQLTGYIPDWIGDSLANLLLLDLQDNSLKGHIPYSLGNATSLAFLLLNSNRLTGRVHHSLGQLENLSKYQ
jgi:Leucine-rich repeat (LRR) protein